jgi:hypothetical protein
MEELGKHKYFKVYYIHGKDKTRHYSHTEVWDEEWSSVRICNAIKDHVGGGARMLSMEPGKHECTLNYYDGRGFCVVEDIEE